MPKVIKITKEKWEELCMSHTQQEIIDIYDGVSPTWVHAQNRKFECRPQKICQRCGIRFYTELKTIRLCEKCRNTKRKPRTKVKNKPHESQAFKIEAELRAQGKRYADYQKADTIAKFARVEVPK